MRLDSTDAALNVLQAGQNYFVRGGSDQYLLKLEELLVNNGHHVVPFAAEHPENNANPWLKYFPPRVNFENPGVLDLIRYYYSRPAAKCLSRLLQVQRIDIAHLHIYYGQLTASILSPLNRAGVPIVQTLHDYKLVCPTYSLFAKGAICEACEGHKFYRAILRRCKNGSFARSLVSATETTLSCWLGSLKRVDHFIAVSNFMKNKLVELGTPAGKISTVHNFVDAGRIEPVYRPGGYLLYFGRLETNKGLYTLIEAMAGLEDVELVIVGNGAYREELMILLEERQISNVTLRPFCRGSDLNELLRNCFCSVLPSHWYEGFPMTILESFAMGKPVITSDLGGMSEAVENGVDGFLVEPRDVAELREKIRWMATHPVDVERMGRSARVKVERVYNAERHYEQILRIYRKLTR